MDTIIETLWITASLVIFLIPAALLTITYLIKRNGFYVSANCWFCNSWTKVLYADRNSFCCPSCFQYNGFNEDGGYNKIIEAQFDTSFNRHYNKTAQKTAFSSNGFCTYCNNNQQLKVRQLANFVPLNEKNYDIEVEHFRMQLEKSYKLCKKCDKVLKQTIEKQHAWLFGNHIKDLKKKGLSLLKLNKSKRFSESSFKFLCVNFVRYVLILLSLIIFGQAITAHVNDSNSIFKKYIPSIFTHYTVFLNEWCRVFSNNTETFIKNMSYKLNLRLTYDYKDLGIMKNDILPITWFGLILEIFLLIWQPKSVLWKANELLGWIILIITSLNIYQDDYSTYVNSVKVMCSMAIIYSHLITPKPRRKWSPQKKNFIFRKLQSKADETNNSDEDICEETSFCSNTSVFGKSSKNVGNLSVPCNQTQNFLFQNMLRSTANYNDTFTTARSTKSSSVLNTSYKNESNCSSNELHHSLDNLHLSSLNFKPQVSTSPTIFSVNSVNRPILSPPKLKNITQNSWTAGGFWKNDATAFPTSTDITNLSRSSSQSSGFVSGNYPVAPNAYNSLPSSREPSLYGDLERNSILSEPVYHFTPINSNIATAQTKHSFSWNTSQLPNACLTKSSQLYYKADNNMFYPVLNRSNVLFLQGNLAPKVNVEGSFSSLSLGNFNTPINRISSPILFGEKPVISSLFKNIPGVNTQSHIFRAPNC